MPGWTTRWVNIIIFFATWVTRSSTVFLPESTVIILVLRDVRVADPVHFRPDPDQENLNFKNRIRILISKFFSNQSDFFRYFHACLFFLPKKIEKFN